jgi:signal transduction histidine kinase
VLNALHHSSAERLDLSLEYSGAGLRMRIRDNGRGIDADMLEKDATDTGVLRECGNAQSELAGSSKFSATQTGALRFSSSRDDA